MIFCALLSFLSSFPSFYHPTHLDKNWKYEVRKCPLIKILFADLHTTLLLEVFSKEAGDCDPSRVVFALVSLYLEDVPGGGIGAFLWARFSLFTLSSSSFPMVFDLTRGNLDRIDNRWKPSLELFMGRSFIEVLKYLIRCEGLGEGWDTGASEQSWGMMEDTVTLSGSASLGILRKRQQWRHTNFRQSRQV